MAYGNNGRSTRRPSRIGRLGADLLTDATALPDFGTFDTFVDQPIIQDQPVIQDQNVATLDVAATEPVVTDESAPVAMPATTTASTPSSPIPGYVAQSGDTFQELPNAWIVVHADGSSETFFKSTVHIDPQCQSYDTADINAGLVCAYDWPNGGGDLYYIPTERWTGQVQSAGELLGNMQRAVALNPQFSDSAVWNIYFNNPSWHVDPSLGANPLPSSIIPKLAALPSDYVPQYIGPTTTSGGATMSIIVPETGEQIDITGTPEPGSAITGSTPITTPSGTTTTINDILYGPVEGRSPGQPGYVPPVYGGPPIDETGSIITEPGPVTGPIRTPPTGGGAVTTVSPAGSGAPNVGMLALVALGAFLFLGRKR